MGEEYDPLDPPDSYWNALEESEARYETIWDRELREAARENARKALTPEEQVAYQNRLAVAALRRRNLWDWVYGDDEAQCASAAEPQENQW